MMRAMSTKPNGTDEGPMAKDAGPKDWTVLDDESLLKWRLCDFKFSLQDTPVQARVQALYEELDAAGLLFRPPCYLATEWLCPDRIPAVGIPFYLAHPRLVRLERAMMLEAEGEGEQDCMKLLRHETGHAINYAYRLFRRTRWRTLFGPITARYTPHHYPRRRYSQQYVTHLQEQYAQAHPDEDFAETFAVWCTPDSNWKSRYKGRAALRKLQYVDHLMREIGQTPPPVTADARHFYWSVARSRSTLATYYKNKRKEFARVYIGYYDGVLKNLFPDMPGGETIKAYRFLQRNRRGIVNEIARWARIPKYAAHDLIMRLTQRAKEMNLTVQDEGAPTLLRVGLCITALAIESRDHYLREVQQETTS